MGLSRDNYARPVDRLYRIIERLIDATFESKHQDKRVLLAALELKARKCKEFIETSVAVRN